MQNTSDVQNVAAGNVGITRRTAYKRLDVLVQQRIKPEATDNRHDDWTTTAAFRHLVGADLFVSGFRAEYPNAQVEFRYLLL